MTDTVQRPSESACKQIVADGIPLAEAILNMIDEHDCSAAAALSAVVNVLIVMVMSEADVSQESAIDGLRDLFAHPEKFAYSDWMRRH